MLAPQAPMNFKLVLMIIYGTQIISRLAFYIVANFFLPQIEHTASSGMSNQLKWSIAGGGLVLSLISEWLHLQARNADPKNNLLALKNCYVMTWGLSEIIAVAGLILSFQYGMQDLMHGLFLSSLLLGLWQMPRFSRL